MLLVARDLTVDQTLGGGPTGRARRGVAGSARLSGRLGPGGRRRSVSGPAVVVGTTGDEDQGRDGPECCDAFGVSHTEFSPFRSTVQAGCGRPDRLVHPTPSVCLRCFWKWCGIAWKIPSGTIAVGSAKGKTPSARIASVSRNRQCQHAPAASKNRPRQHRPRRGASWAASCSLRSTRCTRTASTPCTSSSLDVADGEFLVLVGPSGCGKSTALRMIAGLESITSGELRIGDKVVNDLEPKDRDIAMVFQSYALYPHLTVRNNIAFALKLKKMPKDEINERVEKAARILELTENLDRRPGQLSGGQRQRVRDGPGDRAPAAGVPDGRAAVEPRRQAARADARRGLQDPALAQRHHRLRDPRPDRGDDDGRSGRGAVAWLPAAGRTRRRTSTTIPTTCSSAPSSARRR